MHRSNALLVVWHPSHTEAVEHHLHSKTNGPSQERSLEKLWFPCSHDHSLNIWWQQSSSYKVATAGGAAWPLRVWLRLTHLHAALRLVDGVLQQTLEPALERPALLHQCLVAGDDNVSRARVTLFLKLRSDLPVRDGQGLRSCACTHNCCRLCRGVSSCGTSGLPLIGLRTLLCRGR